MRVPIKSFSIQTDEDGQFQILIDGQKPDMTLIQKLELVINASDMVPFVRLTAIAGKLGVTLGNTELEIKPGDPTKPTFGSTRVAPIEAFERRVGSDSDDDIFGRSKAEHQD